MNITPEQIPDEVVEAAFDAMRLAEARQFGDVKTPNNGARHECMRAALAAALPVLLGEPVLFQVRDRFMEFEWGPWNTFVNEQDRNRDFRRMSEADGWQAEKRDLYTLPTPETPNAHA